MSLMLRYHNDEDSPCFTVFSMEPQYRTILLYGKGTPARVPLPHLFFVFRYSIVPGGYCFPGIYGDGLRVLCSNKPLTKLTDMLCSSPTDHIGTGQVCTDHGWDNAIFDDVEVLTGTILDLWWNTPHWFCVNRQGYDYYGDKWKEMSMEDILKQEWTPATSISSLIGKKEGLMEQPVGKLPSILRKGVGKKAPRRG